LMIKLSEYLDVFIKNLLYRIIRFSTFEFNYFEGGLPAYLSLQFLFSILTVEMIKNNISSFVVDG
ncbi:hypothetical protein, partial [Acinetobacter bereziniae]|uniref:hypothetical protein n=1 Tax=Acinetobacter bereziniae TaxID=106648 RepID=UPI001D0DEDBD